MHLFALACVDVERCVFGVSPLQMIEQKLRRQKRLAAVLTLVDFTVCVCVCVCVFIIRCPFLSPHHFTTSFTHSLIHLLTHHCTADALHLAVSFNHVIAFGTLLFYPFVFFLHFSELL